MATREEAQKVVLFLLGRQWAQKPALTNKEISAFCEQIEHHHSELLFAAARSYAERHTWFPNPGQITEEIIFLLNESGLIPSWDRAWRYVLNCREVALRLPPRARKIPSFNKSTVPIKGIVQTIGWQNILDDPNTYAMHQFQHLYERQVKSFLFKATSSQSVQLALSELVGTMFKPMEYVPLLEAEYED